MAAGDGELALEIRRVVPAGRSRVFTAFTDARELARWWGPVGFTIPRLEFRPMVGKAYRIEMQPPAGEPFHLTGTFLEVTPSDRLSYTFAWEEPDPDDIQTRVELEFRGIGASTEVALKQAPFKTVQRRALHRDGWTQALGKLERLICAER